MLTNVAVLQFLVFYTLLCVLCSALAIIDLRRIIPDGLNLSIAGLGLVKLVVAGSATAGIEAVGEGVATA